MLKSDHAVGTQLLHHLRASRSRLHALLKVQNILAFAAEGLGHDTGTSLEIIPQSERNANIRLILSREAAALSHTVAELLAEEQPQGRLRADLVCADTAFRPTGVERPLG